MKELSSSLLFLLVCTALQTQLRSAEKSEPNYTEAKVPHYSLPDPLFFQNGLRVNTAEKWAKRRLEILHLFEENIYGKTPIGRPPKMKFIKRKKVDDFLIGKATLS